MSHIIDKKQDQITAEAFASLGAPEVVYVREILVEDLQDELSEDLAAGVIGADGFDDQLMAIEPGTKLYALHAANGVRMAVVDSREAALVAAREYALTPVSLH